MTSPSFNTSGYLITISVADTTGEVKSFSLTKTYTFTNDILTNKEVN